MATAEQKHVLSNITLTPTQAEVAQSVIDALKVPDGTRTLVIINGLSGVGKSTVLNSLLRVLPQYNAVTVEPSDIKYSENLSQNKKLLVTATTLGDFESTSDDIRELAIKKMPGISVQVFDLPGMDKKEILEYSTRLKHTNTLSSEQIIRYSMGIPLLAERIAHEGIDERIASQIAATYLIENFRQIGNFDRLISAARSFLQMPVPAEVLERLTEQRIRNNKGIYEDLFDVLTKQNELMKRRGISEDSPLFIAPESEPMYDKILQDRKDNSYAWIDIFVPKLSTATLAKLQRGFGFTSGTYFWEYPSRIEMFFATARKVSIWHKDEHGQEVIYEGEQQKTKAIAHALNEAFSNHELPISSHGTKEPAAFYVHAHDHSGLIHNPVRIGWLTESFLQQNGVPYFVLNRTYGANYAYDPENKHIVISEKEIDLDKYLYGRTQIS